MNRIVSTSTNNRINLLEKKNSSIYNNFIYFSTSNLIRAKESLKDFYKTLEISKTSTKKEIKESFYKVSREIIYYYVLYIVYDYDYYHHQLL